jgi:hypothetical protein
VDRIIFEQVGQSDRIGQIVDSQHLKIRIFRKNPKNLTANPSKPVNTYLYGHYILLLELAVAAPTYCKRMKINADC